MLPDYLIYDELKKRREREEQERDRERPRLEVPRYIPLWPEEDDEGRQEDADSDVIIIKM